MAYTYQVLFREHMEQAEYEKTARAWNPVKYNADEWAETFVKSGFKYACLTTKHHDGYCLWDTKTTDYNSMAQAPKRDLVREYVDAMRRHGIKVGLCIIPGVTGENQHIMKDRRRIRKALQR